MHRRLTRLALPRLLWTAVLTLTVVASTGAARASVVLQYSFEEMVATSDAIVHARVVNQRSERSELSIVTEVELEVVACFKGPYAPGERLTILQQGGVVGELAMVVPGAPTFTTGEEVVLFLEDNAEQPVPLVMGLSQGKFTVVLDASSHQRMVTRDLAGLTLVEPDGTARTPMVRPPELPTQPTPDTPRSVTPRLDVEPVWVRFDVFVTEIERLVEEAGGL